jgi:hypothetical protein
LDNLAKLRAAFFTSLKMAIAQPRNHRVVATSEAEKTLTVSGASTKIFCQQALWRATTI